MNILAVQGTSLISRAIECDTWSKYSHVALEHGGMVYEATTPKVRKIPLSVWSAQFQKQAVDCFTLAGGFTPEQIAEAIAFCEQHLGDPYAVNALFRFLFRDAKEGQEEWICSTYVTAALRAAGIWLQVRLDLEKFTPALVVISPLLISSGRKEPGEILWRFFA